MWDTNMVVHYFFEASVPGPQFEPSFLGELRQLVQSHQVVVSSIVVTELALKISAAFPKECIDENGNRLRTRDDWMVFLEGHGINVEAPGNAAPVNLPTVDPFDAAIAGHARHKSRVLFTTDKKIRGSDSVTTRRMDV